MISFWLAPSERAQACWSRPEVHNFTHTTHAISRQTYFVWKKRYGGASVPELQRLKGLEQENTKLKRMYAELALENAAIRDVLHRKL